MRNIIYLFIHKLSAPSLGSPRWFIFLELATVGGRFFLFKWGVTCCQRGKNFDLLWGSNYKALKTLFPLLKSMRNTIYLFIPRLLNVIKCYFSFSSPCSSSSLFAGVVAGVVAGVFIREWSGGTPVSETHSSNMLVDIIPDMLLSSSEGSTILGHSVQSWRLHIYEGRQVQDPRCRWQLLHLQRCTCFFLGILKSYLDVDVHTLYIGNDISQWYTMIWETGCDWLAWTSQRDDPSKSHAVIGLYIWPSLITSNGYCVYRLVRDAIICQFHLVWCSHHVQDKTRWLWREKYNIFILVNEKSCVFIKLMINYLCLSLFEERGSPGSIFTGFLIKIIEKNAGPYMLIPISFHTISH